MKIDLTAWTDAQLSSCPFPDTRVDAEIARRKAEGIWLKDGSTERVARLVRDNSSGSKVRRDLRRRTKNNPD